MNVLVDVNDLKKLLIRASVNIMTAGVPEEQDMFFKLSAKVVKTTKAKPKKLKVQILFGDNKIEAIRAARAMFGLGLKEAKEIIEGDRIVGSVGSDDEFRIETIKNIAHDNSVNVKFLKSK